MGLTKTGDKIQLLLAAHLQHPVRHQFTHVGLDLLLDILKVVCVRDVELLGVEHVPEHPAVLQQHGVHVGLAHVGHLRRQSGHGAAVSIVRGNAGVGCAQNFLAEQVHHAAV